MIDIAQRVAESRRRDNWPRQHNYMSEIGSECERYLVYSRTHWEKKETPSDYLLSIFSEGDMHEKQVLKDLRESGFRVTEEQVRFFDKDLLLSGKPDGRLVDEATKDSWLLEIKSMSPNIWPKVDTYEDMVDSPFFWVRRYPAQMQAYLHYDREKNEKDSKGMFLLKNKTSGQLKQIEVEYDEAFALEIMLKAERINKAVDIYNGPDRDEVEVSDTFPERVSISDGLCEKCDFNALCRPGQEFGPQTEVIHDDGLLDLLRQREGLLDASRQYKAIDKLAKDALKGREVVMLGEFISRSKRQHVKARVVGAHDRWTTTIKRKA